MKKGVKGYHISECSYFPARVIALLWIGKDNISPEQRSYVRKWLIQHQTKFRLLASGKRTKQREYCKWLVNDMLKGGQRRFTHRISNSTEN